MKNSILDTIFTKKCRTLEHFFMAAAKLHQQAVEKRWRGSGCKAKIAEKRSLHGVNEHFEAIFNAADATQVVFQQPARGAAEALEDSHMVDIEYQQQWAQIILRPNCSASWQSNKRILAAVGIINLLFASGFVAMGAWLVLPFIGLELFLLWYLLRRTFSKLQLQQVVRLDGQTLLIESGHLQLEQRWQCPRHTCSVLVTVLPHPWDPLQISLSHCGEQVALGRFLNKNDSGRLLEELRRLGLPVRQFGVEGYMDA